MLTILIPTRNHCHYLKSLVPVLLAQNCPASKIIIGNDDSTDDTDIYLQSYTSNPRLKVVKNSERMGGISTTAKLFKLVSTRYVMFMSSDDYFYPDKISKLLETAIAKNAAMCFGKYQIEEDGKLIELRHPGWVSRQLPGSSEFINLLAHDHYVFFGSAIFEVEALPRFDESASPFDFRYNDLVKFDGLGEFRAHDWNLALKMASSHAKRVEFFNEYCSVFRKVKNQLSSDDKYLYTGRAAFEMALILIEYLKSYENRRMLRENKYCLNKTIELFELKKSFVKKSDSEFYESVYWPVLEAAGALIHH